MLEDEWAVAREKLDKRKRETKDGMIRAQKRRRMQEHPWLYSSTIWEATLCSTKETRIPDYFLHTTTFP